MINIGNFTVNSNPSGDFSVNATTGQITYNGASARYVKVAADWSFDTVSPVVTTTLTMYLSKNGGTVISGKSKQWTFTLSVVASRIGASLSDTVLMSAGDTIQLGGFYTATASLTFYSLGYDIVQAT
jgi:hypothetical protein